MESLIIDSTDDRNPGKVVNSEDNRWQWQNNSLCIGVWDRNKMIFFSAAKHGGCSIHGHD